MKIIHLSDLHIGYRDSIDQCHDIVNKIISDFGNLATEYAILFTGDGVDMCVPALLEQYAIILERLAEQGFMVLVVPGNHDEGTGIAQTKEHALLFQGAIYGEVKKFPYIDYAEDVRFIGLDSMAMELHWNDFFGANGELGKRQLLDLDRMLSKEWDGKTVVYLHHHPFDPKLYHELKDSAALGGILKKHDIDALFFGHNHEGRSWGMQWNIPRVYDGGSSTGKGYYKRPRGPHMIIDLNKSFIHDYNARW